MTDKQSSTVVVSRRVCHACVSLPRGAHCGICDAPVEQQYEPVAYYAIETPRIIENGEVKQWMPAFTWFTPERLSELIGPCKVVERLYRHAQPPAKVLLPPKKYDGWDQKESDLDEALRFNRYREEFAKLNGVKP